MAEPSLDKDLLRQAGEHLGTLAEREHERYLLMFTRHQGRDKSYAQFVKLSRLSREVLELTR